MPSWISSILLFSSSDDSECWFACCIWKWRKKDILQVAISLLVLVGIKTIFFAFYPFFVYFPKESLSEKRENITEYKSDRGKKVLLILNQVHIDYLRIPHTLIHNTQHCFIIFFAGHRYTTWYVHSPHTLHKMSTSSSLLLSCHIIYIAYPFRCFCHCWKMLESDESTWELHSLLFRLPRQTSKQASKNIQLFFHCDQSSEREFPHKIFFFFLSSSSRLLYRLSFLLTQVFFQYTKPS